MKIPRGETAWVNYKDKDGRVMFVLTSKAARDFYFMYRVCEDGSLTKLGKSKSPPDLEQKYKVNEQIGAKT